MTKRDNLACPVCHAERMDETKHHWQCRDCGTTIDYPRRPGEDVVHSGPDPGFGRALRERREDGAR